MDMPAAHTSSCAWTLPLLDTVAIVLDTYTAHMQMHTLFHSTLSILHIVFLYNTFSLLILHRQSVRKKPEEFVLHSLEADFKRKQPFYMGRPAV